VGSEKLEVDIETMNSQTLCLDAGNSRVKLAVFSNGEAEVVDSLPTIEALNDPALLSKRISDMIEGREVKKAGVVTVVPSILDTLRSSLKYAGVKKVVKFDLGKVPFRITYKTPKKLGRDRVAAVYGAYERMKVEGAKPKSFMVIDAGSALTLEFVNKSGNYAGGLITAGPDLVMRSLSLNTEQLPEVELRKVPRLVGRNTKECIQSGIIHGFIEQVRGFIDQYPKEVGYPLEVFLTGGWSGLLAKELKLQDRHFPLLVLEGVDASLRQS